MSMLRRLRVFATFAALAMAAALAFAQALLQLGPMSYARADAPHLRMPVSSSPSFYRRVGGVAFNAVAQGEDGLRVTALHYDAAAADGSRLVVTLQRSDKVFEVRPVLHDWQLVPIARFAADENGSAMTLFGQLKDKALEKQMLDRDGRIINYHPALDNTLLGQRMFQADILIIQPNAAHVFRDARGLILGAGERRHDPERNLVAFNTVRLWQEQQARSGQTFQSYVVGDLGRRVGFDVRGGRLVFSGRPYWAAWKSKYSQEEIQARAAQIERRLEEAITRYNAAVDVASASAPGMSAAQLRQLQDSLRQDRARVDALERQSHAEVEELTAVVQMPAYSAQLSDLIASVDGVNPLVYSALTQVMHYRALFKHFQARDAVQYATFLRSLAAVVPRPQAMTPTVQHAP